MRASNPEECYLHLMEALEAGDVDAMVSLYEPNATFVVSTGHVVAGHAAIREVLQGYLATNASGKIDSVSVVRSDDDSVAITRTKGSFTGLGPDGEPVTMTFHSVEVVRRQPDGSWRFVIDDPTGEGLEVKL